MIAVAPDAIELRQRRLMLPDFLRGLREHAPQVRDADNIVHGFAKNGARAGASHSSISSLSMRAIIN